MEPREKPLNAAPMVVMSRVVWISSSGRWARTPRRGNSTQVLFSPRKFFLRHWDVSEHQKVVLHTNK